MKINKAYKYRIYPEDSQVALLKQCGGNTRFLWNYLWNIQQDYYTDNKSYLSAFDLTYFLPILKKAEGFEFLQNSFSQSLCQVSTNLRRSIGRAFDDDIKAERNKAIAKAMAETDEELKQKKLVRAYRCGFPKFKKKSALSDSFCISTRFKIRRSRVYIPQVGWIRYIKHRQFEGKPKNLTITQDGNQWYCSVCCELDIPEQEISTNLGNIIGIDLGLKEFAVFSDGEIISNPRIYRKKENKVKREHRRFSRKQKGSNRGLKQQSKLRKTYRKISNKRKDFLHKLTHHMITKYDGFILEDLSSKNMMKNHCVAKSIQDASWSEFSRILKYKSSWNFKYFEKIDRFAPSSQICSNCGHRQKMPLDVRVYVCPNCGAEIDRDLNASLNIKCFSILNTSGREEIYGQGESALALSMNCQKELGLAS